MYKRNTKLWE